MKAYLKNRWKYIERNLEFSQQSVCECLVTNAAQISEKALAKKDKKEKQKEELEFTVLGEELYVEQLRPILKKEFPDLGKKIQEESKDNKKEKKKGGKGKKQQVNKLDQQRQKIAKDKIKEHFIKQVEEILSVKKMQFLDDTVNQQIDLIISSQYDWIELKYTAFLMFYGLIREEIMDEKNEELRIEIQMAFRFYRQHLDKIKEGVWGVNPEKSMELSPSLRQDFVQVHGEFSEICNQIAEINLTVLQKYPQFIYQTRFHGNFRGRVKEIYQSQREVLDLTQSWFNSNYVQDKKKKENVKQQSLIFYKSMIGSGKTTLTLGIAQQVKEWRQYLDNNRLQVIFCSAQRPIRDYVSRLAYNSDISFGLMYKQDNGKIGVSINDRYRNESSPILLIGSPQIVNKYLPSKPSSRYILFYDEPTLDTDQKDNVYTQNLVKMIPRYPTLTILGSSTLPNIEDVPNFVKIFKASHENAVAEMVYSQEFQIGLKGFDFQGEIFMPHFFVEKKEDIQILVQKLKQNPFLQRFYHGEIVSDMLNVLKENIEDEKEKEKIPDITKLSKLNHYEISKILFQLLDILENNFSESLLQAIQKQTNQQKGIRYYDILEKGSQFNESCLIGCQDPYQFGISFTENNLWQNFEWKQHVDNINQYFRDVDHWEQKFEKEKLQIEKDFDRQKKDKEKKEIEMAKEIQSLSENFYKNTPKLELQGKDFFKNKELLDLDIEDINELLHQNNLRQKNCPKLLNEEHVENIVQNAVFKNSEEKQEIDKNLENKTVIYLENLPFYKIGLFSKLQDQDFQEFIVDLMSNKKLQYFISDDQACYGINIPVTNIIINDDISQQHSINTIFQLMGRAGRVGQSCQGNIYMSEKTVEKIKSFIQNNEVHKEAQIFEELALKFLQQFEEQEEQ